MAKFVRLQIPTYTDLVKSVIKHDGRLLEVMTDPIFMFEKWNSHCTLGSIAGYSEEGIFVTVPKAWCIELNEEEIQIAELLSKTFWERAEYPDSEKDLLLVNL